ncbi:MOSC domain-containing protein [Sulfitobacter sp. W002]|uniref:MOSC domain-containing protein n=1 Tax=Sulfitobacter sp. W002 TaxID=2867024 RepID=UPI0021A7416A|nr:MOSC domain-containing protein [Sulfitobacter sp. W002]UWR31651.1 MOSC domain-containing protein [Sulfitobacter sp. W002]
MQVTALNRHPLKAHGRETVERVTLRAGQSMPYDRLWAVAHDASKAAPGDWARCLNFTRGASSPQLQAITAKLDETTEKLTLRHPTRGEITFHPDREQAAFLDWVRPLVAEGRAAPADILRLDGRGYTDSAEPTLSLNSLASHAAVEALAGSPLQTARWRGNIWFDGAAPWDEFEWIGRDLKIGEARLHVSKRITRCLATTVNTDTGARDLDTLAALDQLGHRDFGVTLTVTTGGEIAVGDELELI